MPNDGSVYGRRPGRVNRRIAAKSLSAVLCRTTEAIIRFVVGNASPNVNPRHSGRAHFARPKPEIQMRWGWFWVPGSREGAPRNDGPPQAKGPAQVPAQFRERSQLEISTSQQRVHPS
jgi:hypothetical protein